MGCNVVRRRRLVPSSVCLAKPHDRRSLVQQQLTAVWCHLIGVHAAAPVDAYDLASLVCGRIPVHHWITSFLALSYPKSAAGKRRVSASKGAKKGGHKALLQFVPMIPYEIPSAIFPYALRLQFLIVSGETNRSIATSTQLRLRTSHSMMHASSMGGRSNALT